MKKGRRQGRPYRRTRHPARQAAQAAERVLEHLVGGRIHLGRVQPAELGWGTHENWKPKNAKKHKKGCKAAIYLEQPGANTRVRTWCPTPGPQYGFLVTHNESISIADYFTVRNKARRCRLPPDLPLRLPSGQ
jgi:homospermidine synthase